MLWKPFISLWVMVQEWPIRAHYAAGMTNRRPFSFSDSLWVRSTMWNVRFTQSSTLPGNSSCCEATGWVCRPVWVTELGLHRMIWSACIKSSFYLLYGTDIYNGRERHSSTEHALFYEAESLWWFWWELSNTLLQCIFCPFKSISREK